MCWDESCDSNTVLMRLLLHMAMNSKINNLREIVLLKAFQVFNPNKKEEFDLSSRKQLRWKLKQESLILITQGLVPPSNTKLALVASYRWEATASMNHMIRDKNSQSHWQSFRSYEISLLNIIELLGEIGGVVFKGDIPICLWQGEVRHLLQSVPMGEAVQYQANVELHFMMRW